MKHEQQIVIKRWIPILEEEEKTRGNQQRGFLRTSGLFAQPIIFLPRNFADTTGDGSNQRRIRFRYFLREEWSALT
jgi:hypothetical protein